MGEDKVPADVTQPPAETRSPATEGERASAEPKRSAWRILRVRSALHVLAALCFLGSALGALTLLALFLWPSVNWVTYFFIVRPPFIWFALLVPGVVLGLLALRGRWLLIGCAFMAVCYLGCDEWVQCVKPFAARARSRFDSARMAHRHFQKREGAALEWNSMPLRIVSWNVAAGRFGGESAVAELDALEPDIVIMQEFEWGAKSHVRDNLDSSPVLSAYFLKGSHCALLSRFPLTRLPSPGLARWNCAVYRAEVGPGKAIIIVNVHLTRPTLKTQIVHGWTPESIREAIQTSQSETNAVFELVKRYSEEAPVILAGDFNLPAGYPELRKLRALLKDCYAKNGFGYGKTAPARWRGRRIPPVMRIDLVWAPSNARVYYCGVVPSVSSDHDMVLAELDMPVGIAPSDGPRASEEASDSP